MGAKHEREDSNNQITAQFNERIIDAEDTC